MPTPRKVFIGSSKQYIKLAHALRMTFEHDRSQLDVRVWDVTNWKKGHDSLTSLIDFLDQFQFGVFLLTPDDTVLPNRINPQVDAPRDNVILELGMWFGRVGRDRTWCVVPSNHKVKTPSDLLGSNPITYWLPSDLEIEAQSEDELKSLFANAHDTIRGYIDEYQRRSKDELLKLHVNRIQNVLKTAGEGEAIQLLKEGLSNLLLERAAVSHMSVSESLSTMLAWTKSLLDGLDTDQFADEQSRQFDAIWVFAPKPLETVPGTNLRRMRETVIQNLFEKGVPYRYFVESDQDKETILMCLREAGRGRGDLEEVIRNKVSFTTLPEESFLSYFTIHFYKDTIAVYQSVVCDNRDDFILRIDPNRARTVQRLIQKLDSFHAARAS
jgi:hypothetical protein